MPMKYLESWDFYNVKNYLLAKEYVDGNFLRLKYLLPSDVTLSEGECYEYLINYFTRFPDAVHSYSLKTVGRSNQISIPYLMNIGGVVKYR
jgi:hypothetical protein